MDVQAHATWGAEQKHGMEVMLRAGSTGVAIGVGYHYSIKVKAEASIKVTPHIAKDAEHLAQKCKEVTSKGCGECLQHYTKLHVSRWGYGELGKSGKHSCRWWKPAGKPVSAGYCSMWDGKSKTDREITESSDCDEGIEMAPLE